MYRGQRIALIIPALNEAEGLGDVVRGISREVIDEMIVVDNGSHDGTAEVARREWASVVIEPRRGYGSACLAGLRVMGNVDIVAFMDADGSDDPRDLIRVVQTLVDENFDFVVGSRTLGQREAGALTPIQVFGNRLTCFLVEKAWKVSYTDLGPLRAIRTSALDRLQMADPNFGWTIEMQVKAAQQRLRVGEIPVNYYRRRSGESKVSGTVRGSFLAGKKIISYVVRAKLVDVLHETRSY